MRNRSAVRTHMVLIFGFALVLAASGAQAKSCFSGSNIVDPAKVDADKNGIKNDPTHWFPGRGGNLTRSVRDVAASDPDFAKTIVSQAHVARQSTSGSGGNEQSAAIGAGLGQASVVCQNLPEEAAKIQQAASESPDPYLVASYSSTTGNTQTAATGGGGDSAGGSGGSAGANPTGSGSGGSTLLSDSESGFSNGFQNLLTFGSASSAGSIATAGSTNTAITNVTQTDGNGTGVHSDH